MEGFALIIALTGLVAALLLPPIYGLAVYTFVLLGHPQNITVPLGTLDFSSARIVALGLIVRVLLDTRLRKQFRWTAMDTWVVLGYIGTLLALNQTTPPRIYLERESGTFVDVILPYFAARLTLVNKEDLIKLIKSLILIGIPLAFMGMIQTVTGTNPMAFFGAVTNLQMRHGFYRANVTSHVSISFGLIFAAIAPMAIGLIAQRTWPRVLILASSGILVCGLLSSMSSAPYFALSAAIAMFLWFPFRRFSLALAVLMLLFIIFVEVFSNRHFYHVLTRLAYSENTAYYRIALWEEALGGGMNGHWIAGYGYVGIGPGNDNTYFNWFHKDLVNIYIYYLARCGLLGLVPFFVMNMLCYSRLFRAFRITRNPADQWLTWCVGSAIVGWNWAFMTVGALEQTDTLLYMLAATANNMVPLMERTQSHNDHLIIKAPVRQIGNKQVPASS